MSQKLFSGEIKSWNEAKGFGFIASAAEHRTVFVHIKDFKGTKRIPTVGEGVNYQMGVDSQNRPCAIQVVFDNDKKPALTIKLKVTLIVVVLLFMAFMATAVLKGNLPVAVLWVYLLLSLITYIIYWRDKSAAKRKKWRTKEDTLHLLALFGGWPGALLGQQLIRHKSKKLSFQIIFWMVVIINLTAFIWFFSDTGNSFLMAIIDQAVAVYRSFF